MPRSAIALLNSSVSSEPNVCKKRIGAGPSVSLPHAAIDATIPRAEATNDSRHDTARM
jgi:hypothetical protein